LLIISVNAIILIDNFTLFCHQTSHLKLYSHSDLRTLPFWWGDSRFEDPSPDLPKSPVLRLTLPFCENEQKMLKSAWKWAKNAQKCDSFGWIVYSSRKIPNRAPAVRVHSGNFNSFSRPKITNLPRFLWILDL